MTSITAPAVSPVASAREPGREGEEDAEVALTGGVRLSAKGGERASGWALG